MSAVHQLPDFPWDRLVPFRELAAKHPDGVCDLSIGTPVDPVPDLIQAALAEAADSPGYPTTVGTSELRQSYVEWAQRTLNATVDPDSVLPSIGSKELIAWLPSLLGIGEGQTVVIPQTAYPTYEVSALLAGATPLRADSLTALGPSRPAMIWLNTPSNPTGKVLGIEHLKKVVEFARERDVVVASDECYLELGWDAQPLSILDDAVSGGDHRNLLAVYSLSKRSNLAGYRAGFVAGDTALIKRILDVRKHAGFMMPTPIQHAAAVALADDDHVIVQRDRYEARRRRLAQGLKAAGFRIDESAAGLYLWATRDEPCMDSVAWLAERGIVVAPGDFYGPSGAQHIRVAFTATDERVAAAHSRLTAS